MEVRFDPETHTLMRDQVAAIINPFDMWAIEEGLRLRDRHGGNVTVVTMGPPQAEKELREAVAMGCDRAVFLCDRGFAGADTWATAYTLACAIRKLAPYDVVLCGRQAMDGDTGQVGPGIANQLGIPQLTYVSRIRAVDAVEQTVQVERLLEEGREVVSAPLPAVITVVKDINQPRYPTFRGIRRAKRMAIAPWGPADIEAAPERLGLQGSPTQVVRVFSPDRRQGEVLLMSGDTSEAQANALVAQLAQNGLV
jgi:electron transfer flavoprotein beta subunit